MSSLLAERLPVESLSQIIRYLPHSDRLNLSSTSSQLRNILIPQIFTGIRITNLENEDAITDVIAKYGHYVRHLHFKCYLSDNHGDQVPPLENPTTVLPDSTTKILEGNDLSHISSITVQFEIEDDFYGDGWDAGGNCSIYIHDKPDDADDAAESEKEFSWRNVMMRVWRHISSNSFIRELNIESLPPRVASTWISAEWVAFLGRLESLSVGVWGGNNGAGWQSNTTEGYSDFLEDLDMYFFDHTVSLKRLSIVADRDNSWGGQHSHGAELSLGQADQMPHLEELRLENCIIDFNLVRFLTSHSNILQEVHFAECMSLYDNPLAFQETSWDDLFNEIYACSTSLKELVIFNRKVPLTVKEGRHHGSDAFVPPQDEEDDVKEVRERLKREAGARLFAYCNVDDKYGSCYSDETNNLRRFKSGEDLAAYTRLMSLVEVNCKKAVASG